MLMASIRHCLANLLRFSGRDAPERFWPYAFALFVLTMAAIWTWMTRVTAAFERLAVAHPEQATVSYGAGVTRITVQANSPELVPALQEMMIGIGTIAAIFVGMMAAAVVRRLHDRGRTGWWGALPVALLAIGLIGMTRLFGAIGPAGLDDRLSSLIFCVNVADLASVLCLAVILAGPGTQGPNEFGSAREPD